MTIGADEVIVATFNRTLDATEYMLKYQKIGSDEVLSRPASAFTGDAVSFVLNFTDESDLGDYRLIDIAWNGSNAATYEVP